MPQMTHQKLLSLAMTSVFVLSGLCTGAVMSVPHASAQVFNGGGLNEGVNQANGIEGLAKGADVRSVVEQVLFAVLDYLALAAVIMIVVAGFTLVLSAGSETARDKAKKIILYVVIGLLVILFARVIVLLIVTILDPQSSASSPLR